MNTKNISHLKLIIFAVFFMQITVTHAQEKYKMQIDDIFEISANKISSGILIDRSPAILDMSGYNPANKPQIDTCSLYKWMCLYYRLYASHLNFNVFQYDKDIATQYLTNEKLRTNNIPLGIIFHNYHKLKANAVQDGLLLVDTVNQKIYDVSGAGTPVEPATCFAFSPMADTIPAGNYLFYIDPTLFVSNKTTTLNQLYIDFDNGQGYLQVALGQTVNISYSLLGKKTLKVKNVWNGDTLLAYSYLYITENEPPPPMQIAGVPVPDILPTEYPNNGIKAEYGIWYRCNHNNTIHKPILIVSGFDPQDRNRIWDTNPDKNKIYLYNVANKDNFLSRLRELGYDIIIYRSKDSRQSIIPNAMNLVNFITEKVNNVKTSDNELIVIGTSMGGLVCRYALTYMENKNIPHKTKLFISMDSPQNGANVPLGFQFMAYYLNQDLFKTITMLKDAVEKMLGCDAAQEMLLYHYINTSNNTARCSSKRTAFLNNLASIGNFPKKCTTMAISVGSGIGKNQGFSAGASLIKKNPSFLLGTTIGLTLETLLLLLGIPFPVTTIAQSVTWEFEVNAVPNQTSKSVYKEDISLNVCIPKVKIIYEWWWFLLGWPPIVIPYLDCKPHLIDRNEVVNNTMPIDNAPGAVSGFHNLKCMDLKGLDDVFSTLGVMEIDPNYDCFIPSYSSLGLNVAPHTNIKSYLNTSTGVVKINEHFYFNTNKSVSPFDFLYIENENLDHIYDDDTKEGVFSPEMLDAMATFISPKNLYLENKNILSGQSVAYEASETISAGYSVDNISTNNGDFNVESGGSLDMKSEQIFLKHGFHAKGGSKVRIKADNSWVCPEGSIQSVSLFPLSNIAWEEVSTTITPPQNLISEDESTLLVEQKMENEIRFFPNPVENILNLQIFNQVMGEIRITIIDIKGQPVYSNLITNNVDNAIDCSKLNSGVYFVILAFKDHTQTIKIIKH